jgi:glycosyltransferase involved in cell wall biosynthesis
VKRHQPAVGIVVPVRDEEELLGPCLRSLMTAMDRTGGTGVSAVRAVVVLDRCVDRSRQIAAAAARLLDPGRSRLAVLECEAGNVGTARRMGMEWLLDDLRHHQRADVWLASTDADARVPPWWLEQQLARRDGGVEAWAGTVVVDNWIGRPDPLRAAFEDRYRHTPSGHVHGANMGCRADAYCSAGGFPPVETAEDHQLWRRLGAIGASRLHDPDCPVYTSARARGRAPLGFAALLNQMQDRIEEELDGVD